MARRKRTVKMDENDDEVRKIAEIILDEARKRAKYEMDCLTEMVLQEAKIVARYAQRKPFYIA